MSRIYASINKKYVIMTNQKCGYSSLCEVFKNKKNIVNDFDKNWDNSILKKFVKNNNLNEYNKILIIRDPIKRICSFFKNWVLDTKNDNIIFIRLKKIMSNKYHLFKTNLNINNSISFEIFCQYLKQIIDSNHTYKCHLQPQYMLYYDNNVPLFEINTILNLENFDYEYFKQITSYNFCHKNKSSLYNYEDFLNDNSIALLKEFYKKDYELFYK
jgi:hypothetical protein